MDVVTLWARARHKPKVRVFGFGIRLCPNQTKLTTMLVASGKRLLSSSVYTIQSIMLGLCKRGDITGSMA
jgi:hypothetical protein